jgi:hypothetical protein
VNVVVVAGAIDDNINSDRPCKVGPLHHGK